MQEPFQYATYDGGYRSVCGPINNRTQKWIHEETIPVESVVLREEMFRTTWQEAGPW